MNDKFSHALRASADKSINTFLGFIEGLVMDGEINAKEFEALLVWNEVYKDLLSDEPFISILPHLHKFAGGAASDDFKIRFSAVIELCKSRKYYVHGTADIQRLHGILAGIICDGTICAAELVGLNHWMKEHDYLEDDVFFREIYAVLRPIRTRKEFTEHEVGRVFAEIKKYVDVDNHAKLRTVVDDEGNPDFYRGEVNIKSGKYCFTGASSRFSKKQWRELVESNGAFFSDDMTGTVDYLVVCNKGNSAWAHVSYGRKFEQAKKIQAAGGAVLILTEDDFLARIGVV